MTIRSALFTVLTLTAAAAAATALAGSEPGEPELLMRSGPGSAYQVPVGTSWTSKTPSLNNNGIAAISLNAVPPDNHAAVWSGDADSGGLVDIAGEASALYTDVDINLAGEIVWVRNESTQNGILGYDPVSEQTSFLTNAPLGASSWTAVQVNDAAELGYRAGFGFSGNAWVSWSLSEGTDIHLAESGVDSNSPYAFLFTPSFNNNREIAGKAAINTFTTNQIVIADRNGNVQVLVEDNNLDPASPFASFNNSVGFNDNGQVAFIAGLVGGGRGVYVTDTDGWTEVALEGEDDLDEIEFFSPRLNNAGQVVFRGFNTAGDRAVWLADGNGVVPLATRGDIVQTDLGPARLESPDSVGGPNFGGSPALNDQGEVAFVSLLTDPNNSAVSFGRGLFVVAVEVEALTLTKSADPMTYDAAGQTIEYNYLIENSGNVPIPGPFEVDDNQEQVACPAGDLDPGQALNCTAERIISQADLDGGSVTNIATASAGEVQSNTDTITVTAEQMPALSLVKSAEPVIFDAVDQVIEYSYLVENIGNITLAGPVEVDDDQEAVICPDGSLAPGQTLICTAERVISQDDVDAGTVTNSAVASAGETSSNTAMFTIATPGVFTDRFEQQD